MLRTLYRVKEKTNKIKVYIDYNPDICLGNLSYSYIFLPFKQTTLIHLSKFDASQTHKQHKLYKSLT